MKFGAVPVAQAEGGVAVHSIRQSGLVLKKGTLIGKPEIAALQAAGIAEIVVARIEPGDVSEDVAAAEIAAAVAGTGARVDRYTAFVALTHDPKIDDPALTHALARDCFYIGALGSKKTHGRRLERLKGEGVSEAALARIHAPIGLDIGAVSPSEIAVAIMGEITARLRKSPEKAA